MKILPYLKQKIKRISKKVPKKWKQMMSFGIEALSLKPFDSLNTNARLCLEKRSTAESKMYRIVSHPKLSGIFSTLLLHWWSITPESVMNLDFTIEGKFAILCLAVQTHEGRSIPVWVDVLAYPVNDHSQNLFILDTLREFQSVVGCSFKLVCDRGFIGSWLVGGFLDLNLKIYVRMKQGKHWLVQGKKRWLHRQRKLDEQGVMYGEHLRVVRSSKTLQKQLTAKEPWYILTNDFESTREDILKFYYYRFEIEETFKDLKHILNFKPKWFKKVSSVRTLLQFQMLGFWLLRSASQVIPETVSILNSVHPHHLCSWVRQMFEIITRERTKLITPFLSRRREVIYS